MSEWRGRGAPRRWSTILIGGVLALAGGCGGDDADVSAKTSETRTTDQGEVVGDPADLPVVEATVEEIEDGTDLVDHLLPGLSGPGVDCVVEKIDVAEVLDNSIKDGARTAAEVVTDCVGTEHFGRIMAMYATALDPDSEIQYDDIERCVAREYSKTDDANHVKLAWVLEARLDPDAPVAAPAVALEDIYYSTGCLDDFDLDLEAGATTTTTTTTTTTITTGTTLPSGGRQMSWTFVNAGSCVLSLPEGDDPIITVVPCDTPHAGEVMMSGLGGAPEPNKCQDVAASYVGGKELPWQADIVTLTRTELSNVTRTICIITPTDGSKVTGSAKG